MSLFKNSYSGLITKGLGMPACCGLLTMGFGVFFCTVEVITPPPPGGGGGGSIAIKPGVHVPWRPKQIKGKTKTVQITVKFSKDRAWRRAYIVNNVRADILVKVINVINSTASRFSVGVNRVRQVTKQVTAVFRRSDK